MDCLLTNLCLLLLTFLQVWLSIGSKKTTPPSSIIPDSFVDVPSQAFLCQLVQIFPKIFAHVQDHFVRDMFADFARGECFM